MPKNTSLHHLRSIDDLDESINNERFESRPNLKKVKGNKPFGKTPTKKKPFTRKRREDDFD